jgi:gliding motility-associated-like protein
MLNVRICPLPAPPLKDTICQGESYNRYGFTLPAQHIPDNHTYLQELTGMYGCDSIVTLHLTVRPLPEKSFTARIPVNEPYNANGFSVPPQQKTGVFSFENQFNNHYGCDGVATLHLTVYAEIIPDKYFSPNNDEINDGWNIKNIEYFHVVSVEIYDRFGKLLIRYTGQFTPWDGKYLGNPMPSTDYWYVITLEEEVKQHVGHFTLLR